jgi:hypothetical protein
MGAIHQRRALILLNDHNLMRLSPMLILLTERASGLFPNAMSYHANVLFPVGHGLPPCGGTPLHGGTRLGFKLVLS